MDKSTFRLGTGSLGSWSWKAREETGGWVDSCRWLLVTCWGQPERLGEATRGREEERQEERRRGAGAAKKGEKLENVHEFESSSQLVCGAQTAEKCCCNGQMLEMIDQTSVLPGDLKARRGLWQKPHCLLKPCSPPKKQPASEHCGDRKGRQIRDTESEIR